MTSQYGYINPSKPSERRKRHNNEANDFENQPFKRSTTAEELERQQSQASDQMEVPEQDENAVIDSTSAAQKNSKPSERRKKRTMVNDDSNAPKRAENLLSRPKTYQEQQPASSLIPSKDDVKQNLNVKEESDLPTHWAPMNENENFKIITLSPSENGQELMTVEESFYNSMNSYTDQIIQVKPSFCITSAGKNDFNVY